MEYDFNNWNVEIIQEPNKLMSILKQFNLKGKKIKNIKIVGLCYNLTEDEIEDTMYKYYNVLENDKETLYSKYRNIPNQIELDRYAVIDEPIIIEFEDNDRLEIDYSETSSLKIGLNTLPKDIKYGTNQDNVDGNILFSNCIGEEIIGYEVIMKDELEINNTFTYSHNIDIPSNQESYIQGFNLILTNNLKICFNSYYDYGEVVVIESPNKYTKITWYELKKGLKNFNMNTGYNKQEQEILDGIYEGNIDISRIDYLLKNGANVNAQDDYAIEDGHIMNSLFQTIIYNYPLESKINLVEILKCFINNGLDINKFASSIISDFHYIAILNQDIYEMTKILLNNSPTKLDIKDAQSGISLESAGLTCIYPIDYTDNQDEIANKLDGVYEILEKYKNDKDYNEIYYCKEIIGQTFEKIFLSGNYKIVDKNTIEYPFNPTSIPKLYTLIQCSNDNLLIKDNYKVYIDNDENIIGENEFTKNANEYFKDEKIRDIKFYHSFTKYGMGRTCEIIFTNNKRMIYGNDEQKDTEYLKIL